MEVSFNWSEYNKLTCIYGFRNKINGKLYIGQTKVCGKKKTY